MTRNKLPNRDCKERHRNPESGYALLLIFAMAAIVAITLYTEVPRVAFEAQRDKEQLLVDRGQEYSRAIALFVRKNNRFPGTMEELDDSNRVRFLRRHFVDPMTGKADWRILHAGPGGVITDSVLTAKKTDSSSSPSGFITDLGNLVGGAVANRTDGVNLATRQRPSDQGGSGSSSSGDTLGRDPAGYNPAGSSAPASNGPIPGYNGPVMVLPDGRIVPANASGTAPPTPGTLPTGATGPGSMPTTPGFPPFPGQVPGQPGQQPQLPNGVAIQQPQQNFPNNPNQPGGGGPPGSAASLINQILTTPRPGGINGLPGQGGGAFGGTGGGTTVGPQGNTTAGPGINAGSQQQVIGAGLAGVASKREQEGIKTVNDRTKYNEWEFVYDITKDPARAGQRPAGAPGGTGGQGGAPTQSGPSSPFNPGTPPFAPPPPSGPGR